MAIQSEYNGGNQMTHPRGTTAMTKSTAPPLALQHRPGCPAADGKLPPDPSDTANPRKAIGIEAYVVTGTGRYNRATGEFDAIPRTGVVRCLECAVQALVDPADVPAIQKMIAAVVIASREG